MRTLITILLFMTTISNWAQTKDEKEKQARIEFVLSSNFPDKLLDFYNQQKIKPNYKINQDLNPFYLRGDFDGDKKIDYALAVIEMETDKKGILIYHPTTKKYFMAGAGKSIPNSRVDDYKWMDAWQVFDEKIVGQGVTNLKPPKLVGEAILVQKLESSSGLIYWDGREYKWYQQGD